MSLKFKFTKPEVNNGTAVVSVDGENTYLDNLPEGLTKKVVKQLEKYNREYIDTFDEAVGQTAADVFKKHKDVDEITFTAPFGTEKRSNVQAVVRREVERLNPSTKERFVTPAIRTTVNWSGAKGSKSKHSEVVAKLRDTLAG